MPDRLSIAWVKNVYNMWYHYGMNCAQSYTGYIHAKQTHKESSVKAVIYTHLTTSFTPPQYTAIFSKFNLLLPYLSPLSTTPIISKTK